MTFRLSLLLASTLFILNSCSSGYYGHLSRAKTNKKTTTVKVVYHNVGNQYVELIVDSIAEVIDKPIEVIDKPVVENVKVIASTEVKNKIKKSEASLSPKYYDIAIYSSKPLKVKKQMFNATVVLIGLVLIVFGIWAISVYVANAMAGLGYLALIVGIIMLLSGIVMSA